MTIENEMRTVQVLSYSDDYDDYGQKRQGVATQRDTKMCVKIYSQTPTGDVRYSKVELIGLTKDTQITDKNEIMIDNTKYTVLYVIPSSRLYQVLMMKK